MPEPVQQKDIDYQPEQKVYSFSRIPQEKEKRKNSLNTIFTLFFALLTFFLLFFVSIAILNYFRVISLSSIVPLAKKLPVAISQTPPPPPAYDKENNSWSFDGTLYSYNKYVLKIKYYNQIITLQFIPGESRFFTQIGSEIQPVGSESAEITQILGFLSDLEQEKNIGKKVSVVYTKDKNGSNIIQTITLKY